MCNEREVDKCFIFAGGEWMKVGEGVRIWTMGVAIEIGKWAVWRVYVEET